MLLSSLWCSGMRLGARGKVEADGRSLWRSTYRLACSLRQIPGGAPAPQRYCCVKSCRRPALPATGGRRQCSAVTPTQPKVHLHARRAHYPIRRKRCYSRCFLFCFVETNWRWQPPSPVVNDGRYYHDRRCPTFWANWMPARVHGTKSRQR
ncbi:hypothetical protein KCP73_23620 [Salmonella enterica subsp. enterica]|nr:hypothetical protein KCP73_23620 [Salmonella enterica subsp. enterica]